MICKGSAVKAVTEWGIDAQADVLGPADLRIYRLAHVLGPLGLDMTTHATVGFESRFHRGYCTKRIEERTVCGDLHVEIHQAMHEDAATPENGHKRNCTIQVGRPFGRLAHSIS